MDDCLARAVNASGPAATEDNLFRPATQAVAPGRWRGTLRMPRQPPTGQTERYFAPAGASQAPGAGITTVGPA